MKPINWQICLLYNIHLENRFGMNLFQHEEQSANIAECTKCNYGVNIHWL